MPKPRDCWRKVSIGNGDIYILLNMPIAILSWKFIFGWFKSRDELIAANVEGERAGDGNSDWNRDGKVSNGNVDSTRDSGVQLAGGAGQHEHPNEENKRNVPMSSRPPIQYPECPYRHIKCHHWHGRIKIILVKVNPVQEDETTYRICVNMTQPHGNARMCRYGVIGPRHGCGQINQHLEMSVKQKSKRLTLDVLTQFAWRGDLKME